MKKPGEFQATCKLGREVLVAKATPEQRAEAEAQKYVKLMRRDDRNRAICYWLFPECSGFETTDRMAYGEHLREFHPKHAREVKGDAEALQKRTRAPWRAPRLSEAGKPFEPTDLEPGAFVHWNEIVDGESAARTGQVWCTGWRPRSAWVIPFDKLPGETAVLIETAHNGSLRHYSTQYGSKRGAA